MKVTEFDGKLSAYLVDRFIPKLTNPLTKFALGAAVGAGAARLDVLGAGALGALGVVKGDEVDVEALKRAVYGGFDAVKGPLPVNKMGIGTLDRADADAFFAYLEPPQPASTTPTTS